MGKASITISSKGDFSNTLRFIRCLESGNLFSILQTYAQRGVDNLRDYTPVDTGLARDSWYYNIVVNRDYARIDWLNSDIENNQNVILLLEYGHGTKKGGWVEGIDIVDPALTPVFNDMIKDIWKEVLNK